MEEKISLIGLGKLGLPLLACMAKAGYRTLGVDIEEDVVEAVNNGVSPVAEPGLQDLIGEFGGDRLEASLEHKRAIEETDISYILTATPSNPDGTFSNRHVEAALTSLARAFAGIDKDYHLFVISSTVVPGSTEGSFIPLIEKHSGRKLNEDFGVAFDPDFVALGKVVKDFLNPDLIIIGESEKRAGDIVEEIHLNMCENDPHVSRMSIINGELSKVCLNAYITMKVTYANTLANLCEKIPGADCDSITNGIGPDKRISPHYFSGGLAFGGTCFPRDTKAFCQIAKTYGVEPKLIEATEEVNNYQNAHLAEVVLKQLNNIDNKTVGIMGLAFKDDTPVITKSPAIELIQILLEHDINVVAYDKLATGSAKELFDGQITFVNHPHHLLDLSGLAVLTYRSNEFKEAAEAYASSSHTKIIDCWRTIDQSKLDESIEYMALGRFLG